MWGKPPFDIADNCAVDVRNLTAAEEWYMEKLGLHKSKTAREEDSGQPFADLHISNYDDVFLSLVELEPGVPAENQHVVLFTKNLDKAHQWLAVRGVAVEPTSTDSGGNRLFRLLDLEGNMIEVCVEPGWLQPPAPVVL